MCGLSRPSIQYALRLPAPVPRPGSITVATGAARQRASFLWLDVLRENARAIEFYRRFGFRALGEDTYAIGAQTFRFHLMGFKAG
jgi:hypothetical protein